MAHVLLLHPFPVDSTFWNPVAEALRQAGHEVTAPDLPGFGARADEPGWTLAGEANRLAAKVSAGAMVVGLSMGGYLAFALLAAHGDRVGSLVLADTRASAETPEGREARGAAADALRRDGSAQFLDAFVPRALGHMTALEQPDEFADLLLDHAGAGAL